VRGLRSPQVILDGGECPLDRQPAFTANPKCEGGKLGVGMVSARRAPSPLMAARSLPADQVILIGAVRPWIIDCTRVFECAPDLANFVFSGFRTVIAPRSIRVLACEQANGQDF